MKKKQNHPQFEERTLLVKTRSEFESEIDAFVQKYLDLKVAKISNEQELDEYEEKFSRISSVAREFLKYAFSKPHNEYQDDFDRCDDGIGIFDALRRVDIHSFENRLNYFRQGVLCKLRYLENLKDSVKYIPTTSG
jgi:hypothetical protein